MRFVCIQGLYIKGMKALGITDYTEQAPYKVGQVWHDIFTSLTKIV